MRVDVRRRRRTERRRRPLPRDGIRVALRVPAHPREHVQHSRLQQVLHRLPRHHAFQATLRGVLQRRRGPPRGKIHHRPQTLILTAQLRQRDAGVFGLAIGGIEWRAVVPGIVFGQLDHRMQILQRQCLEGFLVDVRHGAQLPVVGRPGPRQHQLAELAGDHLVDSTEEGPVALFNPRIGLCLWRMHQVQRAEIVARNDLAHARSHAVQLRQRAQQSPVFVRHGVPEARILYRSLGTRLFQPHRKVDGLLGVRDHFDVVGVRLGDDRLQVAPVAFGSWAVHRIVRRDVVFQAAEYHAVVTEAQHVAKRVSKPRHHTCDVLGIVRGTAGRIRHGVPDKHQTMPEGRRFPSVRRRERAQAARQPRQPLDSVGRAQPCRRAHFHTSVSGSPRIPLRRRGARFYTHVHGWSLRRAADRRRARLSNPPSPAPPPGPPPTATAPQPLQTTTFEASAQIIRAPP